MNLDEWKALTEEQRRELVVEWHNKSSLGFGDLLWEAAGSLRENLRGFSEVTNVQIASGEPTGAEYMGMPIVMPVLQACTLLPLSGTVEGILSHFAGFRVELLNLGDYRNEFVRTFSRILKELKGWDENQSLKWVEPWEDALSGGFLYRAVHSHGPIDKAVAALLDEETRCAVTAAGNDGTRLHDKLRSIIWDAVKKAGSSDFHHPDKVEGFDWESVRKEIREAIDLAKQRKAAHEA